MNENDGRLTFEELREALDSQGWSDFTVISFNPLSNEYKIFSHLSSEEMSLTMFEFILEEMLKTLKERKKFTTVNERTVGRC